MRETVFAFSRAMEVIERLIPPNLEHLSVLTL